MKGYLGLMDRQLVIKAPQGDRAAFAELAAAAGDRLHAVAYRMLRHRGLGRHPGSDVRFKRTNPAAGSTYAV